MGSPTTQFALACLAAMLLPTTLMFSVLVLVVSDRPVRTGFWFLLGGLSVNLACGIAASLIFGTDAAASHASTPKAWVSWFDLVGGGVLALLALRVLRRPPNPERAANAIEQIQKVVTSRSLAVFLGGAFLGNAGAVIPIALKSLSELDPSTSEYAALWMLFSLVAVLPLAVALVLLLVAPGVADRVLPGIRLWLEHNAKNVGGVILLALAAEMVYKGLSALT